MRDLEEKALLLLVAGISLLFGWILWPFAGAILWAVVLAILFWPLNQRFLAWMPRHRNLAASLSSLTVVLVVIVPVVIAASLLVQEVAEVYAAYQSGELSIAKILMHARDALPDRAGNLLDTLSETTWTTLPERLGSLLTEAGRFLAQHALNLGKGTIQLVIGVSVMLYLLFGLMRDGPALLRRISDAIPVRAKHKAELAGQFTLAIRAIVKGTLVVAIVQGALGALIFWLLSIRAPLVWGACMAVLSALPVVGTGLIWVPVAVYLGLSGSLWQGIVLMAYGILVIEAADNLLRPILVGKDAQIPDYLVLITTLGGIAVFGANGFVIGPVIAALFLATWQVFGDWRADRRSPAKR